MDVCIAWWSWACGNSCWAIVCNFDINCTDWKIFFEAFVENALLDNINTNNKFSVLKLPCCVKSNSRRSVRIESPSGCQKQTTKCADWHYKHWSSWIKSFELIGGRRRFQYLPNLYLPLQSKHKFRSNHSADVEKIWLRNFV